MTLLPLGDDLSWLKRAACAEFSPKVLDWFPLKGESDEARRIREDDCLAICARCPVQAECARLCGATERELKVRAGIWSGTTPTMRAKKEAA